MNVIHDILHTSRSGASIRTRPGSAGGLFSEALDGATAAASSFRPSDLRGLRIELVDSELAKLAGEAAAAITGATAVDAIVMASAARRGDVVYTSDIEDLQRLCSYFPSVRILAA